ncbi:MAG TPA: serine hydrolase domain-containing protein, partial [Kofleriaceae bacterium]|nr:serine hydrolase domain-containing protein [Kofleriaceae bacterium]
MPIVSSRPCRRGALRLLALALSSSLAACGAARGPSPPLSPPTRVAPRDPLATRWRQIERYVAEELRAGAVPGAAVAVVRGDAAWTRGFGATAIDRSEPVTASTRFPIASLTKLFTGVVILQLVERGALRLDDPVARHVPELAAALSPPGAAPVTVRHLVTHTAGLPDLVDGAVDRRGEIVAMDERQLLAAVAAAPRSPAGERHLYSSTGVALAGLVASRAARAPFADLLERQVLAPLGMTATSARGDAEPVPRRRGGDGSERRSIPAGGVARRSLGGHPAPLLAPCHRGASSIGTSHLLCGEVLGALTPAGGMSSTADDMVRFTRFELGVRRAPEVLSPEAVAASQVDDPLPGAAGIGWLVGR